MSQLKILDINSINPEDIDTLAKNIVLQTMLAIHDAERENKQYETAQKIVYGVKDVIITIPDKFCFYDFFYENEKEEFSKYPELKKLYDIPELAFEEIAVGGDYYQDDFIKGNKLRLTDLLCFVANDTLENLIKKNEKQIERDERRLERLIKEGCVVPADDEGLLSNQKK